MSNYMSVTSVAEVLATASRLSNRGEQMMGELRSALANVDALDTDASFPRDKFTNGFLENYRQVPPEGGGLPLNEAVKEYATEVAGTLEPMAQNVTASMTAYSVTDDLTADDIATETGTPAVDPAGVVDPAAAAGASAGAAPVAGAAGPTGSGTVRLTAAWGPVTTAGRGVGEEPGEAESGTRVSAARFGEPADQEGTVSEAGPAGVDASETAEEASRWQVVAALADVGDDGFDRAGDELESAEGVRDELDAGEPAASRRFTARVRFPGIGQGDDAGSGSAI